MVRVDRNIKEKMWDCIYDMLYDGLVEPSYDCYDICSDIEFAMSLYHASLKDAIHIVLGEY